MDIPMELALENEVLAASLELGTKGDPGADGAPGKDGVTPTIGENGNWYYGSEDSGKPSRGLTGPAGPQGEKGDKGEAGPTGPAGQSGEPGAAGTTFTPAVSDSGVLSWTNDGGKENPASVSIKGPQGEPGQTGPTGPQGPQGETGPRGPQGEQGPTGPAGSYSFDAEPTMDSGNLVKSGGIFAAIPRLIASEGINIESYTGEDGKLSYAIGAPGGVVQLWKNASPESNFAAQTISLDLSGYQAVVVVARYSPSNGGSVSTFVPVGENGNLVLTWGNTGTYTSRSFTVSTTGIAFDAAYVNSDGPYSDNMMPTYIYGIR